jgi:rubredoxin
MTKTEAKAATCTEAGNNEYYTCDVCELVFKDAEGVTETTVAAETIAKLGHSMTKTEAKEAGCTEAGNNEYYTCGTCGKVFKDAEGATETTVEAETIPASHKWDNASCTLPKTCSVCVLHIPASVRPFEIGNSVVLLVAVLVVDFGQVIRIRQKRFSNKPVCVPHALLSVFPQYLLAISRDWMNVWFVLPHFAVINGTVIRYEIQAFKSNCFFKNLFSLLRDP